MSEGKLKVLFMSGSGRSGSTILHSILSQLDGFVALGELRYLWERGMIRNQLCGCGVPFPECPLWQEIMNEAYGGMDKIDARKMFDYTESFRIKNLPSMLIPSMRKREERRLGEYLEKLEKLYQGIHAATGSKVIIDSTKNPSYGYLLQKIPTIDLYVLLSLRDPQAVAYSWAKKKEFQPGVFMARKSAFTSAVQWDVRNLTTELFLKENPDQYMRLRYEDFMVDPRASVAAIVDFMGETAVDLPFTTSHQVELTQATHSVFGNPVRFQSGLVTLKYDDKWQSKMERQDKLTVSMLTWPLRLKYSYFHFARR